MSPVIGLFATPFYRAERLLNAELVAALLARFEGAARQSNSQSSLLSHTELLAPDADPHLLEVGRLMAPKLAELGALMFGQTLPWSIKEMWVNLLRTGGRQSVHNHANSFISGVIYLTRPHPSANTVFMKAMGNGAFVFNNTNPHATLGPFSADKWISPQASPGDVVLFPSHLLHEVPVNQGELRITLAFNAIPDRLDSWGYGIGFTR
jgi:hypothetical protein